MAQMLSSVWRWRPNEPPDTCGVMTQRGSAQSGWSAGRGSGDVTSSAAPRMPPAASTPARASQSTKLPRPTFTRTAPGRIVRRRRASSQPAVASLLGSAPTTTSAPGSSAAAASSVARRSKPGRGRDASRHTPVIVQSKPLRRRATQPPMFPAPNTRTRAPSSEPTGPRSPQRCRCCSSRYAGRFCMRPSTCATTYWDMSCPNPPTAQHSRAPAGNGTSLLVYLSVPAHVICTRRRRDPASAARRSKAGAGSPMTTSARTSACTSSSSGRS